MDHEHYSGKHPKYRGIRCRSGKWVSEIREPRKSNRIWLGTYPTAEMAAVAYDVAVHALRGADAVLNFPNAISSRPIPASASPSHIQAAAAEAAAAAAAACMPKEEGSHSSSSKQGVSGNSNAAESSYVDEEEIFDMPQLLISMAEGMMMSPPRLSPTTSDESLETSDHGDSLWSYH